MPNTLIEPADPNPVYSNEEEVAAPEEKREPILEPEETPEPKPEEKPAEKSEEPPEEDDGFKQFLKENELPESFETPEDFAKAYKEVLRQFKTEQTDRVREPKVEPTPKEAVPEKSYFNTKAADALIKQMDESGMFGDNAELRNSYKSIAKVIDNAYGAELSKAEQVMTTMFTELQKLQDRVRGMEWSGVNPDVRKRVQREQIDKLMQDHRFPDYESAVKFYAMTKDPSIFKLFNKQPENPQANQNKNKQRFRWGARGGEQRNYDSQEWKQYAVQAPSGEWFVDTKKLNSLPKAKGDKYLDAIIKANESRNR